MSATKLTIQYRITRSSRRITTDAFVALLRLCPHLSSVAMIVDWSAVDRCDIASKVYSSCQGFTHENICHVYFFSSRIRHVTGIAAFLSAIAPKLESISAWDPDDDDHPHHEKYHPHHEKYHPHHEKYHPHHEKYSARWRDVFELVKNLSAIPPQERKVMAIAGGADGDGTCTHEEDSEEDSEMESDSDSDEFWGDEE